jgi:hypothetical protein
MNNRKMNGNWYRCFVRRSSNEQTEDSLARQQAMLRGAAERHRIVDAAAALEGKGARSKQGEER